MAIPRQRYIPEDPWRCPTVPQRIETKQDSTGGMIVPATPYVDLVVVDDRRMAVPLVRQYIVVLEIRQIAHRMLDPSECRCVEHMHVHRRVLPRVLSGAVATEGVDLVADSNGRMINSFRTAGYMRYPMHYALLGLNVFSCHRTCPPLNLSLSST